MSQVFYDSDDEHMPTGMKRVGYDADTQRYTYLDTHSGRTWETRSGNRYGPLHPAGEEPPPLTEEQEHAMRAQYRQAWRYLLPFFVLVGLFLIFVWKIVRGPGSPQPQVECRGDNEPYRIVRGDTCWDVALKFGTTVDELRAQNPDLDCDRLQVGAYMCVPHEMDHVVST